MFTPPVSCCIAFLLLQAIDQGGDGDGLYAEMIGIEVKENGGVRVCTAEGACRRTFGSTLLNRSNSTIPQSINSTVDQWLLPNILLTQRG